MRLGLTAQQLWEDFEKTSGRWCHLPFRFIARVPAFLMKMASFTPCILSIWFFCWESHAQLIACVPTFLMKMASFTPLFFQSGSFARSLTPSQSIMWFFRATWSISTDWWISVRDSFLLALVYFIPSNVSSPYLVLWHIHNSDEGSSMVPKYISW